MSIASKYNEMFSSDIFNQKPEMSSKPSKDSLGSLKKTFLTSSHLISNDIFGTSANKLSSSTNPNQSNTNFQIRTGKRIYQRPADNLTISNAATSQKAPSNPSGNKRNLSSVFNHYESKDYIVKKVRSSSTYDPEPYFENETASQRLAKEFYNGAPMQSNQTKEYFIKQEEYENNKDVEKKPNSPTKKKCQWHYNGNTNVKYSESGDKMHPKLKTKMLRLKQLQSNIFNDPAKQNVSLENKEEFIDTEIATTGSEVKKTWHVVHSKWPKTKQHWDNPENELIFKKFNDEKSAELSAFERKQYFLSRSTCDQMGNDITQYEHPVKKRDIKLNVNDNSGDIKRIKNLKSITTPKLTEDKKMKYIENVSSIGFDEGFYLRNAKFGDKKDREHQYEMTNVQGDVDDGSVKRMLVKEGLHAFDVNLMTDGLHGHKVTFKVRENDDMDFERKMGEIKERMKKEKGIEIEPMKRIEVKRKRREGNFLWKENRAYLDEDHTRTMYQRDPNRKRERLSEEFKMINNKYKNEGISVNLKNQENI